MDSEDMGIIENIALQAAGHFRTMLRTLLTGYHIEQGLVLLEKRHRARQALLPDDINAVLASYAFSSEEDMISRLIQHWRSSRRIHQLSDEDKLRIAQEVLEKHDMGCIANLAYLQYTRSSAVHEDAAQRRAAGLGKAPRGGPAAAAAATAGREAGAEAAEGSEAAPEQSSSSDAAAAAAGVEPAAKRSRLEGQTDAGSGAGAVPAKGGRLTLPELPVLAPGEFNRLRELLLAKVGTPAGRYAGSRLALARALLARFEGGDFGVSPTGRSYVLVAKAALNAGARDAARATFDAALARGALSYSTLYEHMQPAFLRLAAREGVLPGVIDDDGAAGDVAGSGEEGRPLTVSTLLSAHPRSRKWCFLAAAGQAALGDQQGSKHGGVLVRRGGGGGAGDASTKRGGQPQPGAGGGCPVCGDAACNRDAHPEFEAVLAVGCNHRYAPAGDPHVRVMHSEVHCLTQTLTREAARAQRAAAAAAAGQEQPLQASPDALPTYMDPPCLPLITLAHAKTTNRADKKILLERAAALPPPPFPEPSSPFFADAEVFIVELDGEGVGYLEAVPCPQCSMALCKYGVTTSHYSSQTGLRTMSSVHRPALRAESIALALKRTYPPPTRCPDGAPGHPDFAFTELGTPACGGVAAGAAQGGSEAALQ